MGNTKVLQICPHGGILCGLQPILKCPCQTVGHVGHDTTKPVFGVFHKPRFKPACSATETS